MNIPALPYTVRPLTSTDEPFLWEMLYLAIYVPEGTPPPSRDILKLPEIAKYVQHWGRSDDAGLIAIDAETRNPIGAVWLRQFLENDKGYGYVADDIPELSIAVLPKYRGKGLGTRLLGDLITAMTPKSRPISLSVDATNPAVVLYKRFGFETVGINGTSLTMLRFSTNA
ncbi:MAG: GNAT family N-acetyltransferase [Chloroflexota bacterium]